MILKRLPDLGFEVKVQNGPMPNWDAQMKILQPNENIITCSLSNFAPICHNICDWKCQ